MSLEPGLVLVVEDDPDGRDALVELCRRTAHTCLSASSRAEALAEVVRRPPDAMVLDLMLPDGSGVEVLRVVREHRFPVRVAVVTAASDPQLLAEVQRLKPDALFRKPVDLLELRAWLDHPADPTRGLVGARIRLQILASLAEGELTVGELSTRLRCDEPTLRHHLAVLERPGIVVNCPDHERVFYRLGPGARPVAPGVVDVAVDTATVRLKLDREPPPAR